MHVPLPQPKPVAQSAFCNARAKLDENIFKILNTAIIQAYDTPSTDSTFKHHRIFAVDGSKINLPRPLRHDGYRIPSDNAYYPQGLRSCLYQLKSKIPTDFDLLAHGDERQAALTHLGALRENDVVVYDRGYFSYAMIYFHITRGIQCIFRLKKNTYTVIDELIASPETDQVVEIKPATKSQKEIRLAYPDIDFIPIALRLIKYSVGDTTYFLATTLLDQARYKAQAFADVYHARWGVEDKISKQLMEIEDFHAQTTRGVKQVPTSPSSP